jgi:hypothetical protein
MAEHKERKEKTEKSAAKLSLLAEDKAVDQTLSTLFATVCRFYGWI